jgi:hypothetical protein
MLPAMSNQSGEPVIPPELPLSPIPEPPPASPEESQPPETPLEPGDWRRVD